jgi:hypothetical protein
MDGEGSEFWLAEADILARLRAAARFPPASGQHPPDCESMI